MTQIGDVKDHHADGLFNLKMTNFIIGINNNRFSLIYVNIVNSVSEGNSWIKVIV